MEKDYKLMELLIDNLLRLQDCEIITDEDFVKYVAEIIWGSPICLKGGMKKKNGT